MKRIRIGKDISMRWEITTDGVAIPLDGRDLTVEIKSPTGIENNIPYRIDGNILIMTYYGYEQKRTGEYSITLWEKKGKLGQNVVDVIRAFELVRTSQEENDFVGGDLQIESVDLGTGNFDILTEGGYRAINIDTLQAEALEDSVNINGKTYSNESFTITLPKANLDSAGVMSADDKHTLQEHGNRIAQINTTLEEHTESINARITTDRISDGAVTSDKIATTAFDSTLSVSGKIAPADVVGERLTELGQKVDGINLPDAVAGQIASNGAWNLSNNTFHYIIPINPGDTFRIVGNTAKKRYTRWTLLKTYPSTIVAANPVDYANGYGSGSEAFPYLVLNANEDTGDIIAPFDAHFLFVSKQLGTDKDRTPSAIFINGVDITKPNGFNLAISTLDGRMTTAEGDIVSLGRRVTNLENGTTFPSWYNDNIDAVLPIVRANNLMSAMRGDSFIFVTDTHIPRNTGYAPTLAKYIAERSNNTFLIHGGDMIDGGNDVTKEDAEGQLRDYVNLIRNNFGRDFRIVFGNHDANQANSNDAEVLSESDFYACAFKNYEDDVAFGEVGGNKKLYYYWDNPTQKIRYFVLDYSAGLASTDFQYAWLSEHISELSSDWRVIIFNHIVLEKAADTYVIPSAYADFVTMLESYKDKVACVIGGHIHNDAIAYSSVVGIPFIACKQDYVGSVTQSFTANALTMFDIDLSTNKIRMARLGLRTIGWGTLIGKEIDIRPL